MSDSMVLRMRYRTNPNVIINRVVLEVRALPVSSVEIGLLYDAFHVSADDQWR